MHQYARFTYGSVYLQLVSMITESFADRGSKKDNRENRYADNLKIVYDILDSVSHDVKTAMDDFADLSERSRDNGKALEGLMREIRGVREDDGVSQKLTGLARLDKLDELSKLDKLDNLDGLSQLIDLKKLSGLEQLVKLSKLDKLDGLDKLDRLNQLDKLSNLENLKILNNLKSLEKLDKLDQLDTLEKLNQNDNSEAILTQLKELSKLSQLEKLDDLSQLKLLDQLSGLARLNGLEKLDALENLNNLQSLQDLKKLEQLDSLKNIGNLEGLQKLNKLDELNKLEALSSLTEMKNLTNLKELEGLQRLSELDKLDNLSQLKDLAKLEDLSRLDNMEGDIRATLDHLIGVHKDTMIELEELRKLKTEVGSLNAVKKQHADLTQEVTQLKQEQRELLLSCGEMRSELKLGINNLEQCENKYLRLESQLRDLTLSKYKGMLGTSALAVLQSAGNTASSQDSQNNDNSSPQKINQLLVKKRNLRTVSLAE